MADIDGGIGQEGEQHGAGEPVEDSFDVLREPLRLQAGGAAGAFGQRAPAGAHPLRGAVIGLARGDHGVGHKGRDEKQQEEDGVACAQILQQLEGCVGIHDGPVPPTNSNLKKEGKKGKERNSGDFHDTLPSWKKKRRGGGSGSETTGYGQGSTRGMIADGRGVWMTQQVFHEDRSFGES